MRPLASLAVLCLIALSAAAATEPEVDLEAQTDAHVAPYLDTGNFSGVVFAARGDRILLSKGYEMANIELGVSNHPSTVFHLASASKPFTTAAILLLEQDGELAVSDPVAKFLPGFPRGEQITLHHLMINSTGIANINAMPVYDELARTPQTPESLVEAFRDAPAEFAPGERYGYSNSNYNLLALIIERASGQSFGDFLRERIFVPLGMSDSGHHGNAAAIIPGRAQGYSPVGLAALERAPWIDWSVKTGNGSVYSTVADLHRFARALSAHELLSAESIEKMLTAQIESTGYGWFVRPRHGRAQVHINGRSPGFTSYFGIYPDDDLIVIVLGNVYNSVATPIGEAVAGLVFGLEIAPPSFSRTALSAIQTSRVVGRFKFSDVFYNPGWIMEVSARDGFLFAEGDWLMPTSDSGTGFVHRRYSSDLEFFGLEDGRYNKVRFDDFEGIRLAD